MASLVGVSMGWGGLGEAPGDFLRIAWSGATSADSIEAYLTNKPGEELAFLNASLSLPTPEEITGVQEGYTGYADNVGGQLLTLILWRQAGWDSAGGTLDIRVEIDDNGTPETWTFSVPIDPVLPTVHKSDYTSEGLGRLLDQFDDSINLRLLASSYLDQAQSFEDVAYQLINAKSLAVISGYQLDGLGQIVNVPRSGRNDDDYRLRIRAELAVLTSQGSTEDLIAVARLLLGLATPPPLEIVEYDPKTVYMRPVDLAVTEAEALVAGPQLRRTVSAATEMLFVYSEYEDDETFTLSSQGATSETSSALGLADVSQTTGGHLSGSA